MQRAIAHKPLIPLALSRADLKARDRSTHCTQRQQRARRCGLVRTSSRSPTLLHAAHQPRLLGVGPFMGPRPTAGVRTSHNRYYVACVNS